MMFVVWPIIILILVSILSTPAIASASTSTSASIFKNARSNYDAGDYTGALFYLKQALNSDPRNVSIITGIGNALNELGNYSQAISFYKKALSLDPYHKGAILGIGGALEKLGNNATTYFKKVLSLSTKEPCSPTNILCNEDDAIALTHLHQYTQALLVINQVLKERPTSIEALNAKGVILLYLQNYTGALAIFNHILTIHPNNIISLSNKCISIQNLGAYQALKCFQHINQKDAITWYDIGYFLDHMGNLTGALQAYNHALTLTPHNQDVQWNRNFTLAVLLYESNKFADAIQIYDAMLKIEPQNSYLQEVRNLALFWEKGLQSLSPPTTNYTEARDYFNKIIAITPNSVTNVTCRYWYSQPCIPSWAIPHPDSPDRPGPCSTSAQSDDTSTTHTR
jgi:tetratricopeptide (TPR) repeat protein